uniref:Disease resistance protein RGA3 n=1 Tax=Nelumbo nucifera TaxID=4432 RepID=A0A822YBW9_NELNU|nr:TPA_asm: hypothetical protein HUJ06_031091 [Nelumbo nucifera]
MAETIFLSAAMRVILIKLGSVFKEFAIIKGVNKELEKLGSTLSTIEAVLQDAEEKQINSPEVKNWLGKLRDAAYDADDVLDEFFVKALRWNREKGMINKVTQLSSPSKLKFRFKIGHKIKKVAKKLDEIAAERLKFHLKMSELEGRVENKETPTDSFVIESKVYGRDEDKENIVKMLINRSDEDEISINKLLRCGAKESKIVVTTRSYKVGDIARTVNQSYSLRILSDDDCWLLFRDGAFRVGEAENFPKLVSIGKEIVKKCGGLPLAAKALGSVLRDKREENEWLSIKDHRDNLVEVDGSGILPALKLSYDHLPFSMKQCFAYCALFPKGYEIPKKTLIRLWIAQGFIHESSSGERDTVLEEIGNKYFSDLQRRCLFQDVVKDEYGNVKACKMHDLVHDLARVVGGMECMNIDFVDENWIRRIPERNIRHASIVCDDNTDTDRVQEVFTPLHNRSPRL